MNHSSAVFGFDVNTPFPLRTARDGHGTDHLLVETSNGNKPETGPRLLNWSPGPGNPLDARLSEYPGSGYVLEIADAGTYVIQPEEKRVTVPVMPDIPLREARLLGLPLMLCFLARGEASLHGAAVMGPSGAIVLAAPGRHGKTSLVATLARDGHRLLTEDLCCLGARGEITLYPGPASLRVREDMAPYLLPVDGMREIGRLDDRLVLAATDPGDGDPVPVAGVVLLKGFEETLSLQQVEPLKSLPDLWLLSFHLPTEEDRARKFSQLVDLVDSVPVWELTQPNDPEAIHDTAETVITTVCR
ncbi:MAG: hypothetical protein ACLFWH_09895 [Actinomycetota bacterium]